MIEHVAIGFEQAPFHRASFRHQLEPLRERAPECVHRNEGLIATLDRIQGDELALEVRCLEHKCTADHEVPWQVIFDDVDIEQAGLNRRKTDIDVFARGPVRVGKDLSCHGAFVCIPTLCLVHIQHISQRVGKLLPAWKFMHLLIPETQLALLKLDEQQGDGLIQYLGDVFDAH